MDPIRDIARYNCVCGKWIVLTKSRTESKPFVCEGPCHSSAITVCGNKHFWDGDRVKVRSFQSP